MKPAHFFKVSSLGRMAATFLFALQLPLAMCAHGSENPAANSAYLFTSFRGNGEEGLRFLYSFDGYHWTNVPGTFLKPSVGPSKLMRDPSLTRGSDGIFHLVWTTGWHTDQGFGYASSKDLVHWSEQRFFPVMAQEPTTVNVWAPELFYDPPSQQFIIIWASTIPGRFPDFLEPHENNHRLYYTTTRDFKNFAPSKLFFEPGCSVIDGFIAKDGDRYILLHKDNSRPQRNLRVAFASQPVGPWGPASPPFTEEFTEGPAALKVGTDWLIYFDMYRANRYGAVRTHDFKTFTNITAEVSFPEGHKHGTALQVEHRDLDYLLAAAPQPGLVKSEFIYETAPFPSCHASTIAQITNGSLVAAWFGGTHERHPDVGIWLSRQVGGRWTPPIEVANGVESPTNRYPCWNPVLFQSKSGPLLLFFKVGPSPGSWWGMLMTSDDGGETWTKPRALPKGILGPIKNKPVQLLKGDIYCSSSTETGGWRVHFERTSDLGQTWQATPPVNDGKEIGAIQPSILFHEGNRLQAVGRTKQGHIFQIWSEDNGVTWGNMTFSSLPNPNSGIDAVTLHDGRQLLVYNHTSKGRSPLNVAISPDGKEWEAGLILEDEPGKEFSYPAVIQTDDGLVHITYTWERRRIKHAVVNLAELRLLPISQGMWPKQAAAKERQEQ
jgi:predicted neuraminidase